MVRWEPEAAARLMTAALELFDEQGYEATTIAEITRRAGLTRRTYFRYFPDKREVLFRGGESSQATWVSAVENAPGDVSPMTAVQAGLAPLSAYFDGLHPAARTRARIIADNTGLQERELLKLEDLTSALAAALTTRGTDQVTAELAARLGTSVYHVAWDRWVAQDDPAALLELMNRAWMQLLDLSREA